MNSLYIALVSFGCVFCGSMFGLFLRRIIPEHHLSHNSTDAVKVGIGLIATLTALVLGLLVSSAKSTFDTMSAEVTQAGAKIILLDRILTLYGSEANQARDQLRRCLGSGLEVIASEPQHDLQAIEKRTSLQDIHDLLRRLSPNNDYQRQILEQARGIMTDLTQLRWLVIEQHQSALPTAFLVMLVLWLTIFFTCFGLLSDANGTVITVMFVCAISVAGAIFLIIEMGDPIGGMIRISLEPLHHALTQVGR